MPKGYIDTEKTKNKSSNQSPNGYKEPLKKSTIITGLLAVIAALAISAAVFLAIDSDADEEDNDTASEDLVGEGVEAGEGRADAPEQAEGRIQAAEAAAEILNLAYVEIQTEEELLEILESIEEGDASFLPDEIDDHVRSADQFGEDDQLQATVYQTLIGFAATFKELEEISPEDEIVISVPDDMLSDYVFYDAELGVAQVSMSVFSQEYPVFSMEMVYTEDGWKFSPYSLVESVAISSMMQQAPGASGIVPGEPDSIPDGMIPEDASPEDFGITEEDIEGLLDEMREENND